MQLTCLLHREVRRGAVVDHMQQTLQLEVMVHEHHTVACLASLARSSSFDARRDANRALCW